MKLPKSAKKVFSGVLFSTYQWKQKLYDGSTITFEMVQRAYCSDVIATVGNKVIVLKQSQPGRNGFYGLPGGRIEKGELSLTGAKRELLEETGFESKNWQKFKSWNEASKIDYEETTFVARNCEMKTLPHTDAGEKIAMQLVTFEELFTMVRLENFVCATGLKFFVYECLLSKELKKDFKKFVFGT